MSSANCQTPEAREDELAAELRQAARRCLHGEITVEEYVVASNRLRRFLFGDGMRDKITILGEP
jgi:hypothetical protein